jgi:hypothetical protein
MVSAELLATVGLAVAIALGALVGVALGDMIVHFIRGRKP